MQGFAADPDCWKGEVFAYVGLPQNLKDLKEHGNFLSIPLHTPLEDHLLDTYYETSAMYCWILEILHFNPKGRRALLRVPSTVGRSVCLCWEHSKP